MKAMKTDRQHQQVLDEAWAWLKRACGWSMRHVVSDEREAQLWRWNGRNGPIR